MAGGASPNEGRALEDRVVVITGAGRGIGREVALCAAREGARVVVNDLGCDAEGSGSDPSIAEGVAAEVRAQGGAALADGSDISLPGAADALVARAIAKNGRLDAIVSCAGILAERSVLKAEPELVERVVRVHLLAAFALVRASANVMSSQAGGGSIVLMSGPSAFFGARGQAAIGAASAGVIALTRSAALELRKHRVRVNAIAPTARTRQTERLPTFESIPESSMSPAHVAPVAVFLASSLAEDISGEVVGIAGARAYAFRVRESTGSFTDGRPLSVREVGEVWREITRG